MRDDVSARLYADDPATSFLLAEHERLAELYLSTREIAERRATLFLTLTTTAVGVIVALFQFKLPPLDFLETALAATVAVLLFGLITFHRLVERSMQGTEYLRAINRLHRYFVDSAPKIEPYLYWPAYDNVPRYDFRGVGGAETREIVALVDSFLVGAAISLAVLIREQRALLPAIALGFVALFAVLFAHRGYEHFAMTREERRKASLVQFPQPTQVAAPPAE